ncbi:MAG TPA: LacI family DNA-binding transcriptional regulator [Solirubrobacteraceae bacterium]|nr:LacI family DNA-binding transcriptional regulator [Solirubrobacteraceae bacterium]
MDGPRVTSVDVARRAGVSQSTVSLVLSGKAAGRVSETTAAAVREAADALGYRPNAAARALKTGAARTVALVVPDVTNPFFGAVLRGAQSAARDAGYAVALVDTANDRAYGTAFAAALQAGPADGLLLFAIDPPPTRGRGTEPIVLIESDVGGHPGVRLDVEGGTEAAIRHLLDLGHRRIGHLASAVEGSTFRLRRRALEALAGDVPAARADFVPEQARDAALELLAAHPGLTAVFCDDDVLASGVYLAARRLGRRIPRDLSVVGFDDLDVARILDPPLTTVTADARELGRVAFELLAARLAGRRPRSRVLDVALTVRESTAPPDSA